MFVFTACSANKQNTDNKAVQQETESKKVDEKKVADDTKDDQKQEETKKTEENKQSEDKKADKTEDNKTATKNETDDKNDEAKKEENDAVQEVPKTVISLGPNITEILYSIGVGDKLIGRTKYCNYPKQVEDIEEIGTLYSPSIERIVELKPDLVIGSTHMKEEVFNKLKDLGIRVEYVYESTSLDGTYEMINKIAEIFDVKEKAEEVIKGMKDKIASIVEKVKDVEKKSVYYVVGFGKSDYTATGDTFIANMLEEAAGINIASDATGWKYRLEKLVEKDPQIIIGSMQKKFKEAFIVTDGYKELSAVKKGNVFEIDEDLLNRQGPRVADGVEAIAKILYPELFK